MLSPRADAPKVIVGLLMKPLDHLFRNNLTWSHTVRVRDPLFFKKLAQQQIPEYLWIGCSDSRVPANTIVGLEPGKIFVHRNVANLIKQADLNCLSAMQFAIDILNVKHIIVCGHYGCSGVYAALCGKRIGLSDNWLGQIRSICLKHEKELEAQDKLERHDRLCELNVIEQVLNACQTTVVQDAWLRGQELTVHGWVYRLEDGVLRDLDVSVSSAEKMVDRYKDAVRSLNPAAAASRAAL